MITLRRATADAHAKLDSGLPVADPSLTMAGYRRFLTRMLGVVAPTELAIDMAKVPLVDWDRRRRTHMLCEDLAVDPAAVLWCEDAQVRLTPDQALGAAYVLEGSTLGGRHVATAVRASVGADAPLRWFESYGDEVPNRWQAFRRQVNARVESGGDIDEIVAGANATFAVMCDWLLSPDVG